ncbi:hypothetical protein AVEN_117765-1 [Araneus ventricosus]|uniref:Uncharacterized protein n=1 Tax=Araneus ventricosus TaxID=182803 RepID=A0A4Y2B823_ARAVE|nr:hypothetical protein AVEN_117765-1 [Araneus ventricosus]
MLVSVEINEINFSFDFLTVRKQRYPENTRAFTIFFNIFCFALTQRPAPINKAKRRLFRFWDLADLTGKEDSEATRHYASRCGWLRRILKK